MVAKLTRYTQQPTKLQLDSSSCFFFSSPICFFPTVKYSFSGSIPVFNLYRCRQMSLLGCLLWLEMVGFHFVMLCDRYVCVWCLFVWFCFRYCWNDGAVIYYAVCKNNTLHAPWLGFHRCQERWSLVGCSSGRCYDDDDVKSSEIVEGRRSRRRIRNRPKLCFHMKSSISCRHRPRWFVSGQESIVLRGKSQLTHQFWKRPHTRRLILLFSSLELVGITAQGGMKKKITTAGTYDQNHSSCVCSKYEGS